MTQPNDHGRLEPLPEDWQRALAIVAHPDDLEFGAGAAVARWTEQGKEVIYSLVTSGEAGISSMEPARTRQVREAEQRAAAALVGVQTIEFLGQSDGLLEHGVALRRVLAAAIRRHQPDIVITNNLRETWNGTTLNQADHIATGRSVLDAVRDAGNRWVFTEQLDEGLRPWGKVRQVWAVNSPQSAHGVDVTTTFQTGVRSLHAHEEYLGALGWPSADSERFLATLARLAGARLGCEYGVSFEVFRP
ncbi:PIG-L deacetylase family protein [Couchioplanes caeruleus]|uniref:GlcNAc-PI de-N-acetylase n=2 Tax=Couchioplanes caeruleus TaxID=56438 RepID=A0A1K0FD07_9ACTN|nr:PIG-L deacetylase family protein [Couchioplanes caeruleus]OJF10717.1 GlcNAc-PI de-N-acetylase [Couchioplanes caeruleus subsp. caeruleus]ROP31295.1 LmbE family N-acetylglucosaminyl deacetylase [Couchioplanes caeruleus]